MKIIVRSVVALAALLLWSGSGQAQNIVIVPVCNAQTLTASPPLGSVEYMDEAGNLCVSGGGGGGGAVTIANGADVTLGAKADAKSTATDTTPITLMSVAKQISASVQAIASSLAGTLTATVTNAGTFLVQAAQSGTWNITNISGTVSLPTGAATSANQTTANSSLATIATNSAMSIPTTQSGAAAAVIGCDKSVVYDASTNGSTQLVALASSQKIYVCGYTILAAGTVNVELDYGTGTACATGNNKMTPAYQLTAQVGIVDGSSFFRGMATAASNELCLKTSAGIAVQATVYYTQF